MNLYDRQFNRLVEHIKNNSKETLILNLISRLNEIKSEIIKDYNNFVDYYNTYSFWGTLNPEIGNFETLISRIDILKNNIDNIVWFYNKLKDYKSKRTLYAILLNWLVINTVLLNDVKINEKQYFDLDIFPNNKDDVFVDCGAYTGDTIKDYISMYGNDYKKIYAYEIELNSFNALKQLTYDNINAINKGISDKDEILYINLLEESSANTLSNIKNENSVQCTSLDNDIKEKISFIKMDIEGYEQKAILGAKEHIKNDTPKLAISIYHGYKALIEIPKMIEEINTNYDFYLRHYGGNLIPTEFILLCKGVDK